MYHTIISTIHESRKAIEYGSITEIRVPRPESSSYFFIKTTIIAKYGISGVIRLVLESPILYATCVRAGDRPRLTIIGTKMGAIMAHFAEAEPINRFKNAEIMTNEIMSGSPVNPMLCKKFAPFTEMIMPRFVLPK